MACLDRLHTGFLARLSMGPVVLVTIFIPAPPVAGMMVGVHCAMGSLLVWIVDLDTSILPVGSLYANTRLYLGCQSNCRQILLNGLWICGQPSALLRPAHISTACSTTMTTNSSLHRYRSSSFDLPSNTVTRVSERVHFGYRREPALSGNVQSP